MTTLFIHAPGEAHTWPDHPENANRGKAVHDLLVQKGVMADLLTPLPRPATERQILAAHNPHMLDYIEEVCLRGGGYLDQDTYATAESHEMALVAAGAVCQAVDLIEQGKARNGYVFARPPGHHAEKRRPGGFCLYNNVAIGGHHLQAQHGRQRVLILDFDVHHGNGTQDIFYDDDSVYFISIHQHSPFFYPGTGSLREMGERSGHRFTLNIGLFEGVGDLGYKRMFHEVIAPKIKAFGPEFIIVSSGFDAHWVDPMAAMNMSLKGFADICRLLVSLAEELCEGRILFVQEGGYVLQALAHGVLNTIYALQRLDLVLDPIGPASQEEPDVTKLLSIVQELHLI